MEFPRLKANAKAIVQSFYHPPLYLTVIREWRGIGAAYLLLLSTILAAFLAALMAYNSERFKADQLPHILAQMPKMTITDGVLKVQGPEPVKVSARTDKGNRMPLLFYIDTKASEEQLLADGGNAIMLVGKDFMLIKTPTKTDRRSFEKIDHFEINPEAIQENWPGPVFITLFFWVLLTFGQFVSLLILCIIVAACSYLVTVSVSESYDFETRMRMSAIAITPPVLLTKTLVIAANHDTGSWFTVLLALFYVYVMLVSSRRLQPLPQA